VNRWSIYIDIEGFSETYETGAQPFRSLRALMTAIYDIGSRVYRESPDRIFAHQLGDGFVIVGEFGWPVLEQPCSIAVALIRAVLLRGGVAKAAIAEGEFADVSGCYPPTIRELHGRAAGGAFPLGGGLMTVFPVMGTALINAFKLLHRPSTLSGALLLLRREDIVRLPEGVPSTVEGDSCYIDWIHAGYEHLEQLHDMAGIHRPPPGVMEEILRAYIRANRVSEAWAANTRRFLGVDS